MEQYCALLQRAIINSRRHLYVTLDKFIAEDAMLTQLKIRYNFFSELGLKPEICNGGYSVSSCELLFFASF